MTSAIPQLSVGRQRGAILVTSMLLLLILTVLGIAMMRMTNVQERMAGNTRDLGLAFQGAEAGLREGEGWLRARTTEPGATSALPCEVCKQYAVGNIPVLPVDLDVQTTDWWEENGTESPEDIDDLAAQPRYVLEEAGFVRDSLLVDEFSGRNFYRVTGQSNGASGLATVVLQSTYARRF